MKLFTQRFLQTILKLTQKLKQSVMLMIIGMVLTSLPLSSIQADASATHADQSPIKAGSPSPTRYRVRVDESEREYPAPILPSLTGFSRKAIESKIRHTPIATIKLKRMIKQPELEDFTAGERLSEWAKRQFSNPQAIYIEHGYATPALIAQKIDKKYFEEMNPGIYIARLPIVVGHEAVLEIGADVLALRLSEERGAFLVNDGQLFIIGTQLTGWRETAQAPATFRGENNFRPFLVSWSGAQLFVVDSIIKSLGYNQSKSYGFTLTKYTSDLKTILDRPNATGWIIQSVFEDLYYGFYSYEADDVAIVKNTYRDNVVYGIDPHDRSRRLIIADNDVFNSRQKHGIIISREVNDSFIFNNRCYRNQLSGIVLDRQSERNIVAGNWASENGGDGITLYESPNNLLWANIVMANKRYGIRVRNSLDIKLHQNVVLLNRMYGVYGHIKDLSETDRDFILDPYLSAVSMSVVGGSLAANSRGPLSVDQPMRLQLYDVDVITPRLENGVQLTGALNEYQELILNILLKQQKAVIIERDYANKTLE